MSNANNMPSCIGSFRYVKRRRRYEKSNLTFDPHAIVGYSYNWYRIVDQINGKVVLNTYKYSRTTSRHVDDIRHILKTFGIHVSLEIQAPRGVSDRHLGLINGHYANVIAELKAKKRRSAAYRALDTLRVEYLEQEISTFNKLINESLFQKEIDFMLGENK